MVTGEIEVRRATAGDRPAVLALAQRALGWTGDRARDRAFFSWKHDDNPFGESPAWVATLGDAILGFSNLPPVGAATRRPDPPLGEGGGYRHGSSCPGERGIFRRLTLDSVNAMREEGVDAVFNTPNDQSRPGYLKMGWVVTQGRPTLGVVPRSPRSLVRVLPLQVACPEMVGSPGERGCPALEALASLVVAGCHWACGAVGDAALARLPTLAVRVSTSELPGRQGAPADCACSEYGSRAEHRGDHLRLAVRPQRSTGRSAVGPKG